MKPSLELKYSDQPAQGPLEQEFINLIDVIPWNELSNVDSTLIVYHLQQNLKILGRVKNGSNVTSLLYYLKQKQDSIQFSERTDERKC